MDTVWECDVQTVNFNTDIKKFHDTYVDEVHKEVHKRLLAPDTPPPNTPSKAGGREHFDAFLTRFAPFEKWIHLTVKSWDFELTERHGDKEIQYQKQILLGFVIGQVPHDCSPEYRYGMHPVDSSSDKYSYTGSTVFMAMVEFGKNARGQVQMTDFSYCCDLFKVPKEKPTAEVAAARGTTQETMERFDRWCEIIEESAESLNKHQKKEAESTESGKKTRVGMPRKGRGQNANKKWKTKRGRIDDSDSLTAQVPMERLTLQDKSPWPNPYWSSSRPQSPVQPASPVTAGPSNDPAARQATAAEDSAAGKGKNKGKGKAGRNEPGNSTT